MRDIVGRPYDRLGRGLVARNKKALSVQSIKAAVKRARNDQPAFDAALSTAMWMLPLQIVVLLSVGVDAVFAIGGAVGLSLALLMAMPFTAGILEATSARHADAMAWGLSLLGAGAAWYWLAGATPAAALVGLGAVIFAYSHRANAARMKAKSQPRGLPPAAVERIAALPKKLSKSLREPLDEALSAHGSLVGLLEPEADPKSPIDAAGMLDDAAACVMQVVERTEAALRLRDVTARSPGVDRAEHQLRAQITELVESLTASVEAAATYTAVGEGDAARELAERAEHLHLIAQSLTQLEEG